AGADEADASAGAATAPKQGSNSGMEQGSNACPSAHGKAKSEEKQSPKHGGNEAGATVAVPHYIAPDPPCTAEEALAIINGLP
ncbi:MAG: hypothetical protein OSA97_06055, partial [Nevskia sp.]|nr:hypothetical protein [Nevskia sp.]